MIGCTRWVNPVDMTIGFRHCNNPKAAMVAYSVKDNFVQYACANCGARWKIYESPIRVELGG